MSKPNRRSFLKSAGVATAGAVAWQIVPPHVLGQGRVPPSERLHIASIGVGGQGRGDFARVAEAADDNMVAICDVDPQQTRVLQRDRSAGEVAQKCKVFTDYRKMLDEGDAVYPAEDYTTQPERFMAAELVREKVLHHTSDELPYTTAVSVDKFDEDEGKNLIRIYATIYVERESQKPIVIGKRGEMVKRIGTEARLDLESILGAKVFLDLHVAVHESWREDERFLGELEWPL